MALTDDHCFIFVDTSLFRLSPCIEHKEILSCNPKIIGIYQGNWYGTKNSVLE